MGEVNRQVLKNNFNLKYHQTFLLAVSCVLVLSFSLPAFAQTSQNQPLSSITKAWPSADSWSIPTIRSPTASYKIEANSGGLYQIPTARNTQPFLPWKLLDDKTLHVSIIKETPLSPDQLASIKKAIVGYGTVKSDAITTYVSWNEALETVPEYKSSSMPTNIVLESDDDEDANVSIYVTDEKNIIYSGYTANVIEHKQIVKSNIIIYDINNLTDKQISSIVRHEFGHALGLRHSAFTDDLMFGAVPVPSYISEHDVATLLSLYGSVINDPSNSGIKTLTNFKSIL